MRDKTHADHIERWIRFINTNPNWREIHNRFINAQFENAYRIIEELRKQPGGKEKISELYGIKNKEGYKKLFT